MIDTSKIDYYIKHHINSKPEFVDVDQQEWENALLGMRETLYSSLADDEIDTKEAWNYIYFGAIHFCKGLEYAEVKLGLRVESNYPRY